MDEYKLFIKGDSTLTYILVHGIGGDWRCWQSMVDALPEGRIFVVNMPGFGGTKPVKRFDQQAFNKYINNFILKVAKPQSKLYLFGHSLGAILLSGASNELKLPVKLRKNTKLALFHFPYATQWLSFGIKNTIKALQILNQDLVNNMMISMKDKNKILIQAYELYKLLIDRYVAEIDKKYGEGQFLDQFIQMDIRTGHDGITFLSQFDYVPYLEQTKLPITIIQGAKDHMLDSKMQKVKFTNPLVHQIWQPDFNHGSYIFEPEKCLALAQVFE